MLNNKTSLSTLTVYSLVLAQILLPLPAFGAISNLPPLVKANVPPNVFYTLDDSGSMMFEVMPDSVTPTGNSTSDGSRKDIFLYCGDDCWTVRTFPSPANVYNVSGNGDYSSALQTVVGFSDNITVARFRSSEVNKIYYDPKIRYEPWIDVTSITTADPYGNPMPNANPDAAKFNPVTVSGMSTATIKLTAEQPRDLFSNISWLNDNANDVTTSPKWTVNGTANKTTFYPATYFQYNPSNLPSCTTSQLSCFKRIEIKSGMTLTTKAPARTDCAAATCTYNEEIINFANWFQYYRSRILTARAGSGRAFANQLPTLRVGFGAINASGTKLLNVSNNFVPAEKQTFLNTLYQHKIPKSGTPLRKAVDDVGQYFKDATVNGPWQTIRGQGPVTDQLSCRQNYNILMTDGYWNGDGAGTGRTGNWDNTNGTEKTSHTGKKYKYTAVAPYKDAESDTLADIAMYYWVNDLRTDWTAAAKKNVPEPRDGSNPAFWQHLVQYTVGFGVKGSLNPSTDLPDLTSGSKTWPAAASNQVDDLWHAAVNSRGKFFNAANPREFSDALDSALNEIAERSGDAAAVATSKNTLEAGLKLYASTYQTADWSGRLEQKSVNPVTGAIISPNDWDTNNKIDAPGERKIFTVTSSNGKGGVAFSFANLNSTDKTVFNTAAGAYAPSFIVTGNDIAEYIKGERSKESKPFRARKVLLGDLVNSDPQYVKEGKEASYSFLPTGFIGKTTYTNYFKKNREERAATVYVGSNDGMLHAFNATAHPTEGGKERFAFIPKAVVPNLPELAKPNYVHRFFVDGTPHIGDAAIGTNVDAPWKTILVGTTGAGAKSVFALDVTDPTAFDASKVLWERNSTTPVVDNDLGFTIGTAQIGAMRDGRWVAVFGNGYDSVSQKAFLYVVDLKSGDIIRKIDTGVGSSTAPNGLATPKLLLDTDATIQAAYAGDRQGNLWKFDFVTTGTAPNLVTTPSLVLAVPLFQATDTSRKQPITTQPQLMPHPDGGNVVVFGTGKIFEDTDAATVDKETIYGIWDKKPSVQVTKSQLVQQTLTASGIYYILSKNAVNWATKRGWYITLDVKNGERVVTDPIVLEDQVFITTLIPGNSTDLCVIDAKSTTLQFSPLVGGALPYKVFPEVTPMVSGVQSSATFGTTLIRLGNRKVKVVQADTLTGNILNKTDAPLSEAIPTARLWRQLIGRP